MVQIMNDMKQIKAFQSENHYRFKRELIIRRIIAFF